MAFIYKNGVEYTAVLDVESLPTADFNRHTVYRMKDINDETQLYVRNADNDDWVILTDVFGTATAGTPGHNGMKGLVPAPTAGSNTRVLDSNKGWTDLKEDTDFVFSGASRTVGGKQGVVPQPVKANYDEVLGGDGTWRNAFIGDLFDPGDQYDLDASPYLVEYVEKAYKRQQGSAAVISEKVLFPAKVKIPPSTSYSYGTCELTIGTNRDADRSTLVLHEKFIRTENSSYGVAKEPIIYERTGTHGKPSYMSAHITDPTEYTWTKWHSSFLTSTITEAGVSGDVPKPEAGSATRVLDSNKGWTDLKQDTDFVFEGSNPYENGKQGLVPVPDSVCRNRVLGGDGTWNVPYIGDEKSSRYDLDGNDYLDEYVVPVVEDVIASESFSTKRSKVVSFPCETILGGWLFYGSCILTISVDKSTEDISLEEKLSLNMPDLVDSITLIRTGHNTNYNTYDAGVASNYNFTDWSILSTGFQGSSMHDDGISGLVPKPEAGSNTRILDANGNWVDLKEFYDFIFTGATPTEDGKQGVVPAPSSGDQDTFLRGNGIWDMVTSVFDRSTTQYSDDSFCSAVISARTKMNARDTITVFQSFGNGLPVPGGGSIYSTVRYADRVSYQLTQLYISATENAMYTRTGWNVPTGGVTGVVVDDFGTNKSLSWTEWAKTAGDATMLKVEVEGYGNTNFYTIDDISKTDSALFPIKTKIEKTCTMKYSLPCKGITIPERSAAQNNSVLFEIFVYVKSETTSEIYIKETSLSCPNSTVWGGSMEWYRYGFVNNHNPVTSESDITWTEWERNTHPFVGATSTARGRQGLVPAPDSTCRNRVLGGDGTWNVPYIGDETSSTYNLDGNDYLTKYVKPVIEDVDASVSSSTKRSKIVSFPAAANITGWLFTGSCTLTMTVDKSTKNITLEERFCTNAVELPYSVVCTRTGHVLDYDEVDAYVASNYEFTNWVVVSDGFLGSTTDEDGTSGLVPAPAAGNQDMFLKADGTWDFPEGSSKATSTNDGIVTKLRSSSQSSYWLRGDNTWQTLPTLSTSQAGIVTTAPNSAYQVLKGTGVWGTPNTATSSYAGAVPALKSSSQSNYYLRGDNTWQTLPLTAASVSYSFSWTSSFSSSSVMRYRCVKVCENVYVMQFTMVLSGSISAGTETNIFSNFKIDGKQLYHDGFTFPLYASNNISDGVVLICGNNGNGQGWVRATKSIPSGSEVSFSGVVITTS